MSESRSKRWPGPEPLRVFEAGCGEELDHYFERMSEPAPLRPRSKAEWLRRRPGLRRRVLEGLALSPAPERLPLAEHRGGTLERDAYQVERLYWQTWPQVWASGWLYVPKEREGRQPAVLCPHGGGDYGFAIALAKRGYVALAVGSASVCEYAVGLTPSTVSAWSCSRAVDLLAARPDVDRDRIGLAASAASAWQAMHLMAVEDRIRAAAVIAGEAPAEPVPGALGFGGGAALCGIFAPRALLLIGSGDAAASFPDEDDIGELRALYRLWQQPDRLTYRRLDPSLDPGDMRREVFAWIERELRGAKAADAAAEPDYEIEDAALLRALDAPPPGDRGTDGILDWFRRRVVAQPPQLESRQSRRSYQERVRAAAVELLGGEPAPVALKTRRQGEERSDDAIAHESLVSFRSERDVRIPAVWHAGRGAAAASVLIALHPRGKRHALRSPLAAAAREAGWAVLTPDVRLRGELRRDWLHHCILWGRPEAGMAVTDVRACIDWAFREEGPEPRTVVLFGEGDLGIAALMASGLDERVAGVVADVGGTLYRDGGEGLAVIPNILRAADVPQIASLTAPRPVWLYNVPPERAGFSSRRYFDWTRRTYQSLGEAAALQMTYAPEPDPAAALAWLNQRLRRARR